MCTDIKDVGVWPDKDLPERDVSWVGIRSEVLTSDDSAVYSGLIRRFARPCNSRLQKDKEESSPVLDLQSLHSPEFLSVARDQRGPQAQRLGGNERIQGTNPCA